MRLPACWDAVRHTAANRQTDRLAITSQTFLFSRHPLVDECASAISGVVQASSNRHISAGRLMCSCYLGTDRISKTTPD
jgi:hypothetical protein